MAGRLELALAGRKVERLDFGLAGLKVGRSGSEWAVLLAFCWADLKVLLKAVLLVASLVFEKAAPMADGWVARSAENWAEGSAVRWVLDLAVQRVEK